MFKAFDGEHWWYSNDELHFIHSLTHKEVDIKNAPFNLDDLIQSTGRRDKNGVLIYEKDIAVYGTTDKKPFYAVCEFEGCGFGLRVYESKDFIWFDDELAETAHLYEIIGNIYENPELLEQ